ncbi:hypothetical protein RB195_018920 [Necator americanus]|uniref:Uncharacterized protein n=1 Tax=Necator americanus TaxID=51031 RepID=A0ABR1CDM1_NECAM
MTYGLKLACVVFCGCISRVVTALSTTSLTGQPARQTISNMYGRTLTPCSTAWFHHLEDLPVMTHLPITITTTKCANLLTSLMKSARIGDVQDMPKFHISLLSRGMKIAPVVQLTVAKRSGVNSSKTPTSRRFGFTFYLYNEIGALVLRWLYLRVFVYSILFFILVGFTLVVPHACFRLLLFSFFLYI